LEDVIARLEDTQFISAISTILYWRGSDCPENKVWRALQIKPNNWLAAFESWYLHHRKRVPAGML
jgi:hypothetical protein